MIEEAVRAPSFVVVRRRLFGQLLASLVYENAVDAEERDGRYTVHGTDRDGVSVRYTFTAARRYGFARVTIGPDPVQRETAGHAAEATSLTRFLDEARTALTADDQCLARFSVELEETLLKDAAAQHTRTVRGDVLAGADYDTLESLVTDGHRYHPTYKSRIGFDIADNLAFGPEFRRPVRPLWIAVRRQIADVSHSAALDENAFLTGHLGEDATASFRERVRGVGGDPANYTLLPVHPWQWREHVASAFAEQLRSGHLVVVGEDGHDFLAQQSIRTLACADEPERPYLKLSLSIVNTSTSRVLAPHTVRNAPAVSDWLRAVVDGDEFLREELRPVVLGEVMGSVVDPTPAAEFAQPRTYGVLACIWRESLHEFLADGEQAVGFAGLTARELDGTPLVDPWVRTSGVRQWVRRLTDVAVVPLLHLLFRHGIALESHAQNMVLIHRDGVPERVALKDFHDGVRFSREHLSDPDGCPPLAAPPAHHVNANSFLETDDVDQVTDFLLDAFFFVNLGELAIFLADEYGLDEREFWSVVTTGIRDYQKRFTELSSRFALFDVFKPALEVEKLTTRRLLPDTELRTHTVPNPLAGA